MKINRRSLIKKSVSALLLTQALDILAPRFTFAQAAGTGRIKNIVRVFLVGGADQTFLYPYYDGPAAAAVRPLRPDIYPKMSDILVPNGFDQTGRVSPVGFHGSWNPLLQKLAEVHCGASLVCEYGVTTGYSFSHEIAKQNFNLASVDIDGTISKGWLARLIDAGHMEAFSVWGIGAEADQRFFNSDTNSPVVVGGLSNISRTTRNFGTFSCDGLGNCPKSGDKTSSVADDVALSRSIAQRLLNEGSHAEIPFEEALRRQMGDVQPTVALVQGKIRPLVLDEAQYGTSGFGSQMKDITRVLMYANSNDAPATLRSSAKVICTSIGGWDSHANILSSIPANITTLAEGLRGLVHNLKVNNLLDSTAIVVESEFSRTLRQNGSLGSDHGGAGRALVIGGTVKLGSIGADPDVSEVTKQNFFTPQVAFTSVWKNVLQEAGFASDVLNSAFPHVFPGEGTLPIFI